ncbi:MAG: iron ABC transporter permease [Candidatus Omnitrophica bacterium]|jgi:iron complex transport system permease protein|nr:iron ABC transporter permease [Candidatus Omnitrophota bacterium]
MENKKPIKWILYTAALFLIVLLTGIICLSIGPTSISFRNIMEAFKTGKNSVNYDIIFDLRLPRIILGFAVGGSLSLAGVILQGMFKNPLVEPYTLGISGGGALGVCLGIVFKLTSLIGSFALPICGFLGSILVILLVYSLSVKKGILKIQGLLLTGVMISFISSSLIMLIMAVSNAANLQGIIFWTMGSLEQPHWILIKTMLFVSILGLFISYFFSINLNAFSLGEEEAHHLGIDTEKTKKILFVLSSLLTGVAVSVSGIIGFVGLAVPHFMRRVVGTDHRILLVSSFLAGAGFLIICDTIARTIIAPMELPVGVITGIVGGSLFVYFLSKKIS